MQPVITIDLMAIYEILRPLALNILGITAYGVFIFNFYRFIARKDIFRLNLQKNNHRKERCSQEDSLGHLLCIQVSDSLSRLRVLLVHRNGIPPIPAGQKSLD